MWTLFIVAKRRKWAGSTRAEHRKPESICIARGKTMAKNSFGLSSPCRMGASEGLALSGQR